MSAGVRNIKFSKVNIPNTHDMWLGGVTVRTLDLWSQGRGFNSRSGRYQVVTTWMGDCLWTGKPSQYITNHQGQLSLPSSGVGKSSTSLQGGAFTCVGWQVTLCDPIWQVTLCSSEVCSPWRAIPISRDWTSTRANLVVVGRLLMVAAWSPWQPAWQQELYWHQT